MTRSKQLQTALLCSFVIAGAGAAHAANSALIPGAADVNAARHAKSVQHALPARTNHGDSLRSIQPLKSKTARPALKSQGFHGQGTRYPGDLQNHGGAVLESIESHAIYVNTSANCKAPSCWGNPEQFLKDLGNSEFVHVVDQYVGLYGNDRYSLGSSAQVQYPTSTTPYTDLDMLIIVHAVAAKTGQTGYGHMYHVFLPPGTDECQDPGLTHCYSPDNFNTFYFCAYHGSVDFSDIGHVVYSVEPYQNVPGCNARPDTPNGQLADSTNSVLSHELIEAITDPDLDAYWNELANGLYGEEIGDECSFLQFTSTDVFFDPSLVRAGKHLYAIQPEYSNRAHACVALN